MWRKGVRSGPSGLARSLSQSVNQSVSQPVSQSKSREVVNMWGYPVLELCSFFAQIGTMSRTVSAGARLRGYRGAPVEPLPPLAPDGNVFRPMLRPLRSSIGDRLSLKEDAAGIYAQSQAAFRMRSVWLGHSMVIVLVGPLKTCTTMSGFHLKPYS